MQTNKGFFDDVAKMTGNALGMLSTFKDECELLVKQQVDKLAISMHFVHRDEFEAVSALAAKARKEQLALIKRIEVLEGLLKVKVEAAAPNAPPNPQNPRSPQSPQNPKREGDKMPPPAKPKPMGK